MVSVIKSLERSLEVPSVKELAAGLGETVPSRYIRDDIIESEINISNNLPICMPTIDLEKLASHGSCQEIELIKLNDACKNWGIFHLINHGVNKDLLCAMKEKTKEFFDLPLYMKKQFAMHDGGIEGFGHHFVLSENQKLEWSDICFLKTFSTHDRNYRFWPDQDPSNYRQTLEAYCEDMKSVGTTLRGFMATGLGLEPKTFSKAYENGKYDIKLLCYPKCPFRVLLIELKIK